MLATDLTVENFPFIKTSDTGNRALDIMENLLINHIVAVDEKKLIGIVAMDDIYNFDLFDTKVENFKIPFIRAYVRENQHFFDVVKTMHIFDISVVPVIDKNENYLGTITQQAIINTLANTLSLRENGFIVQLKISPNDYSATEIANIIEKNDGKLISLFIDDKINGFTVFIKIQTTDIQSIMQSFEHFKYNATLLNIENNEYENLYKDRLDNLLNFLNI